MRTEKIDKLEAEHTHSYGVNWVSDDKTHWHECDCGDKSGEAAHIANSGVVTKRPTVDKTGIKTYSCTVCGTVIRTEEIAKLEAGHTHNFSESWRCDAYKHWKECDCGAREEEAVHTETGEVIKEATVTEKGVVKYSCTVCGNERLEYIDKLTEEFSVDYKDGTAVVTAPKIGKYAVIFAAYDGAGALTNAEICVVSFDEAGEKTVSPVRFSGNSASKVKVMFWSDMANLKPLCEAAGD